MTCQDEGLWSRICTQEVVPSWAYAPDVKNKKPKYPHRRAWARFVRKPGGPDSKKRLVRQTPARDQLGTMFAYHKHQSVEMRFDERGVLGCSVNAGSDMGQMHYNELVEHADKIGVYFAKGDSKPCQFFAPRLIGMCETLKAQGIKFPVVLVPLDEDEEQFTEHYAKLPFATYLPKDDRVKALMQRYKVTATPWLVVLSKISGQVLASQAEAQIGPLGDDEGPSPQQIYESWSNTDPDSK
eukprot:TRINITY_DN18651_c0_g1_i5.p1 TRINITY_DN18651_c0_g1~~TRINITY_DN18651_c0_g1_i5.p1  ORF type:complete len:240 (+),score=46.22 TRINITY_DN18651_c0_g1_i5:271-990(+)